MAKPLRRRRGGCKAVTLRKKELFLSFFLWPKFRLPLSSRGGGQAIMALPLKEKLFLRLPLLVNFFLIGQGRLSHPKK